MAAEICKKLVATGAFAGLLMLDRAPPPIPYEKASSLAERLQGLRQERSDLSSRCGRITALMAIAGVVGSCVEDWFFIPIAFSIYGLRSVIATKREMDFNEDLQLKARTLLKFPELGQTQGMQSTSESRA